MAEKQPLDPSQLSLFASVAGHDGLMSDPSGELIIKPCTTAEIEFYQKTLSEYPDFAELMPTFMGTLQLGASTQIPDPINASDPVDIVQTAKDQSSSLRGKKLVTETAIVLDNLEYGFKRPNVLDIKLGAKLYGDDTEPEKAARLDKVAAETTSGSDNFRIAGMKIWNGESYDHYDKHYGRKFNKSTVEEAFATFLRPLVMALKQQESQDLLETMLAEVTKVRQGLERCELRMYSSSLLIVYEGDKAALSGLIGNEPDAPSGGDERAPTAKEVKEAKEEEEEEEEKEAFKVRVIDFAHAAWTPGEGKDENVIKGMENVELHMDHMIDFFA